MAGLEVHFLLEATILNEGGVTLVWGSHFLGNLVPCCFQVPLYGSHVELA